MIQTIASRPLFFPKSFENKTVLKDLDAIFLKNRGYTFTLPQPNEHVLLVVSGGLDSIMLWFHLMHTYRLIVYPVFFKSHFLSKNHIPGEQESVHFFYTYFKRTFPNLVRPIHTVPIEFNLNLTDKQNLNLTKYNWHVALSGARITSTNEKNVYLLENPTRFARYLASAYEYGLSLQAKGIRIHRLFYGVVPNDSQIGRESTRTVLRALNLYFCLLLGDWSWQITGPVEKELGFYYSKEDSIKIGTKYKIPLEKTWSCARRFPIHCGICNTCRLRQASFYNVGIPDKTLYFVTPGVRSKMGGFIRKLQSFITDKKPRTTPVRSRSKSIKNRFIAKNTVVYMPEYIETFKSADVYFVRNSKTENVATINASGAFIIQLLMQRGSLTVRQLIKKVSLYYKISSNQEIEKDIRLFIESMVREGLIKKKSGLRYSR